GGGAVDPGEDVEGGGLAGAVGTDEAHELTGRDGQLEIREGLEAAEADGDVARMEHGGQGATPGLVVERRERQRRPQSSRLPSIPLGRSSIIVRRSEA